METPIPLADIGLGTTFERWALNRALLRIQQTYRVQSALEGPGDGMTGIAGINSIILGRQGIPVTLHLMDPARAAYAERVWRIHAPELPPTIVTDPHHTFSDGSFDLVWNFNVLASAADPSALLGEMARVSRRYVLFFVPNARNYSFWLHRLHHRVAKQPWDHGDPAWMRLAPWLGLLPARGLQLCETFYVDCPWWPDIVDPRQLVADFLPFARKLVRQSTPENRTRWEPEALPYYEPDRYPEIHRELVRLGFFEDSALPLLKRLFGHHFGVLAEKL